VFKVKRVMNSKSKKAIIHRLAAMFDESLQNFLLPGEA